MSTARRVAFLTLAEVGDFVIDDHLAVAALAARGVAVESVPWRRRDVDWAGFAAVVVRTPWDYQQAPGEFLAVLERIVGAGTLLLNDLARIRWNLDKGYLRDLEARGVPIVPTLWRDGLAPGDLAALAAAVGGGEFLVKPRVGANADGAFRLGPADLARRAREVEGYFAGVPLLAQPFVDSVLTDGEVSLFYFDGALSHAVRKTPAPGDFRVQEEHGGRIDALVPDADLREAGARVLAALDGVPFQARPDFVRAPDGTWWLMELELVEPSLYFRMDPGAPERFAHALVRRLDFCDIP